MEPIEPTTGEKDDRKNGEMRKTDNKTVFGVFTDMVSTISPALMLFFLIISAIKFYQKFIK